MPKPKRSAANYRLYSIDAVKRVQFIRKAKAIGLTLEEIKDILDVKDHGKAPCRRVAEVAAERLEQIDTELARLRVFRRALVAVLPRALVAVLPQWQHDTAVERACAGEFCDLIEGLP